VSRLHLPMFGARVCALGNGPSSRLRMFALYVLFSLRERLGMGRSRPRRVGLNLFGVERDWWVRDRSDFGVLFEVFVTREYEGPRPDHANLVLDLGAHTGASVVWWRHLYPEAEIVAVEPDPESFELLAEHVGQDPGVRLVHAAVAPESGPVSLVRSNQSWESHLSRGQDDEATTPVEGLSFSDLVARVADGHDIDLLKMDVEGAEQWVLASSLRSVSTLAVEMHDAKGAPIDEAVLDEVAAREGMHQEEGRSTGVVWLLRDQPQSNR
jgi:FkbM family methyltransferase